MPKETLLLSFEQVDALLPVDGYREAVEEAYASQAKKLVLEPEFFDVPSEDGEFHVKAGGLVYGEDVYFAVKESGCFFDNQSRYGLPNIYGLIVLCNGKNGTPLAILDAGPVTAKRTAAATAVAAKYLARTGSSVATICGAGTQGRHQLSALARVLSLRRVFIYDVDGQAADEYRRRMEDEVDAEIEAVAPDGLEAAVRGSDVLVTCTPATEPYIRDRYLPPGIFVSAIGSDSAEKQELESSIPKNHKLVVDSEHQCRRIGETHHFIEDFPSEPHEIHAEIGEVVVGTATGRQDDDEIIVFDATGIALQDVASAVRIFEAARQRGVGTHFEFS